MKLYSYGWSDLPESINPTSPAATLDAIKDEFKRLEVNSAATASSDTSAPWTNLFQIRAYVYFSYFQDQIRKRHVFKPKLCRNLKTLMLIQHLSRLFPKYWYLKTFDPQNYFKQPLELRTNYITTLPISHLCIIRSRLV